MTKLKEQISRLPENERLALAQELIQSLSEPNLERFILDFFSHAFKGGFNQSFQDWLKANEKVKAQTEELTTEESAITGEEMKAWIRQQIAESESKYAEEMKSGQVKTFTLSELKAAIDG